MYTRNRCITIQLNPITAVLYCDILSPSPTPNHGTFIGNPLQFRGYLPCAVGAFICGVSAGGGLQTLPPLSSKRIGIFYVVFIER